MCDREKLYVLKLPPSAKSYWITDGNGPANFLFYYYYFKKKFKYDLGQKYQAPQVRPDRGSNSWPPDHDSTFHVTETPALTTWPSVTYLQSNSYSSDTFMIGHSQTPNLAYISFLWHTAKSQNDKLTISVAKGISCINLTYIWIDLKRKGKIKKPKLKIAFFARNYSDDNICGWIWYDCQFVL